MAKAPFPPKGGAPKGKMPPAKPGKGKPVMPSDGDADDKFIPKKGKKGSC